MHSSNTQKEENKKKVAKQKKEPWFHWVYIPNKIFFFLGFFPS